MHHIGSIKKSQIEDVKALAVGIEVKNKKLSCNYQDWMLELIEELCERDLIDMTQKHFDRLCGMQDGLLDI